MKIVAFLVASFLSVTALASPQTQAAPPQTQSPKPYTSADPRIDPTAELHTFRLWEKSAPGALGDTDEDIPTLTYYPATHHDKPTAAIIVAPGGSYHHLAANHEEIGRAHV